MYLLLPTDKIQKLFQHKMQIEEVTKNIKSNQLEVSECCQYYQTDKIYKGRKERKNKWEPHAHC